MNIKKVALKAVVLSVAVYVVKRVFNDFVVELNRKP